MTTASHAYSVDELTAISELLGAGRFPGVGDGMLAGLSEDGRRAALRSARRSLVARDVLRVGSAGYVELDSDHHALMRAALAPELVLVARRGNLDSSETRLFYATPALAVEHSATIGAVHRLSAFPPEDLLRRVLEFLEFQRRPVIEAAPFTTSEEMYSRLRERVLAGKEGGNVGVPPEGRRFVEALSSFVSASTVRSLHGEGSKILGGEISWLDAGEAGLWLVGAATADDDGGRVTIRPVHAKELLESLLDYLPGGDGGRESRVEEVAGQAPGQQA